LRAVVNNDGELVCEDAITATDHRIAELAQVEMTAPLHPVLK